MVWWVSDGIVQHWLQPELVSYPVKSFVYKSRSYIFVNSPISVGMVPVSLLSPARQKHKNIESGGCRYKTGYWCEWTYQPKELPELPSARFRLEWNLQARYHRKTAMRVSSYARVYDRSEYNGRREQMRQTNDMAEHDVLMATVASTHTNFGRNAKF